MEIENVFYNTADYELQKKKLGEGAFGTVYVVKNLIDKKLYAAKIIHTKEGMTGHQQMLLLRESLTLNKLNHPSIVKFKGVNFQSFSEPNILQPTIITEYLINGSLKDNLDKERKSLADSNWTATKKYIMLLGIADAMRYLHAHGIIHRDLKPENILVDLNYYPRVCDFGFSRCFPKSLTKSMKLTMTGQIGTPLYMAPELLKDDEVYTTAVDVYAFSILAYEIVTGKEPFSELGENISPFAFAQKVIKGIRPRFTDGITRKMKNLLRKCWSDDPSERPSFEEIFNELSDLSYFDETLDEDEIEIYIESLKEASEVDTNDQVFNIQKKLDKNEKEKDELKKEVSKLKNDLKKLQDEVNSFKSSEDDFIHVLHALHGCESEKNLKRALFILKKMSEKGDMNASYLAGLLYERGEGVEQDFNTAKKFYLKSVKQGNSHGYNRIGFCYKNGFGIDPNNSKAFEYHKKAADLGNADALNNIGYCYEHEIGVKKDYTKAFEYYKKAASLGNSPGLSNLGLCYEDGTGVDQNFSKAVKYYKEAANLGCPFSANKVGLYYEEGKGVEKDYSKAFKYFQKAADLGSVSGLINLARCYEEGIGVEKDIEKAIQYYQKAADLDSNTAKRAIKRLQDETNDEYEYDYEYE